MKRLRSISTQTWLALLLWVVAMWLLAVGLAGSIEGTRADGFFPVLLLGLILGWTFSRLRWKTLPAWIVMLLIGAAFAFIHNGHLTRPLLKTVRESLRYQWQRIESRQGQADPTELRNAQAGLARATDEVFRRVSNWFTDLRAGRENADPLARQVAWSLLALPLAAWAGWILQRHGRALSALLPSTILLAYLQYYSEPDPLPFQLHLLTLLVLIAVTEGSAPLRAFQSNRSLSGDALTAVFLASSALVLIGGLAPSVSPGDILKNIEGLRRAEQNNQTAEALGLQSGRAINEYHPPGLPREHLLGGPPDLDQTVVFTVRTGDLPPMQYLPFAERPPRYYWRTLTYDTYTGSGWVVTIDASRDEEAGALLLEVIPTGYRLIHLNVDMFSPASRLPWTGELVRANQPLRAAWRTLPDSRMRSLDPLRGADLVGAVFDAQTVRVESILPAFTVEQLRASSTDYPEWVSDEYLNLPADLPSRVRALASGLTASQPTAYNRAIAIESYLRRFPYSLDVPTPPTDRDVVDYFLFDLQTGYCDYYASAMVVLARAAGLPARLVTGYASGEYIPAEAHYLVRESDAHSWVEIYFNGLGWVEFEPTANRPRIERPQESPAASSDIVLPDVSSEPNKNTMEHLLPALRSLPWFSLLAGALTLTAIAFSALMWRTRKQRDDPARTITDIYRQVYRMGEKMIPEFTLSLTPLALADLLAEKLAASARGHRFEKFIAPAPVELKTLTEFYITVTYSSHTLTRADTIQAMKIWRTLIHRLRLAHLSGVRYKSQPITDNDN